MLSNIIKLKNLSSMQIIFLILTSGILIILDQVTKSLVLNMYHANQQSIQVLPFFNITFIINYGISFSMFNHLDYKVLLIISSIALMVAVVLVMSLWERVGFLQLCTTALLIGGACGNLIDRYSYQGVIDFLHFYYKDWHFPIFNLADCFVSLAGFIIFMEIFIKKQK